MGEGKEMQTAYKKLQSLFKKIAQQAALDKDYRELCLKDSRAAIREAGGQDGEISEGIIFLEEDGDYPEQGGQFFVLPPFIKKSWLCGQEKE